MIFRLLLLRAVGFVLIISGLMMVFTQIPLMLKQALGKIRGILRRRGKK